MLRPIASALIPFLVVCTGCSSASSGLGSAGTTANGGGQPVAGSPGSGGKVGTGGAVGSGGAATSGGSTATGGSTSTGGGSSVGGSSNACSVNTTNPFKDCKFAWGAPSGGNNASYLDFVSTWVGSETNGGLSAMSATATNVQCGGCTLARNLASSNALAVFYAYFIGFDGHAAGLPDCNRGGPPNLCTDAALWVRNNHDILINQYAQYAKAVYKVSPNKPVIWWLEGDFVQYTYSDQKQPFTYTELAQLAGDISCAIKSNEPNAVVAMNHSPWIATNIADPFWTEMKKYGSIDMVWVQGPGNSDTFVNSGSYNASSANYNWLHTKTGLPIMAETSYANAGQDDRWTTATADQINARIGHGVIGALVNNPTPTYQSSINSLNPALVSTCN